MKSKEMIKLIVFMLLLCKVKSNTFKDDYLLRSNDSFCCRKSFLNKKNRWYAGLFYFHSSISNYHFNSSIKTGLALPIIGYRHVSKNGTFWGINTLILPSFDAVMYSFLFTGFHLGVPLNCKKNILFYVENGPLCFYTSKKGISLMHIPNFYLNHERCFSKKLAYSFHVGGFIGPALGEKSEWMGPMKGSVPIEYKIVYGFSIKFNIRFI
jgi:hypothetical protein